MFYLSNSSMALFPENTLSDYTTKLPRDFALVGSWEVALSEIMYPSTWNNIADGREYYVKVGVPNEADLKMHLKTAYYKYPEDIFFSSPDRWIENLRKDPLRALCLTASILEKLRSTLQCPSSITGLVKNSDDCSELKLVTSINQGLFAIGYLETFIKVCTPSTFTVTCWSIALLVIHLPFTFHPTRGRTTRLYCLSTIRKNALLPSAKQNL